MANENGTGASDGAKPVFIEAKGLTTQSDEAPATTCPSQRPGVMTTEFWLAVAMLLLSAYLASKGKDELATVLAGIAGTVYTGFRGMVKSKLAAAAVVLFLALAPGCASPGYVKASEIRPLAEAVCKRHDRLVKADPGYLDAKGEKTTLGEQRRASDLRSSEILLGTLKDAEKAGEEQATKDAQTPRADAPKCPEDGGPGPLPHCGCCQDAGVQCATGDPLRCNGCCKVYPCPQGSRR